MKVVLLGSKGQLGTDILSAWCADRQTRFELVTLDRDQLDLADSQKISKVLDELTFDVLVNCTGFHKTDEVESNSDLAFRINAFAVRELARVCADKRARLVHISTDYVFGGLGQRRPYLETDCCAPINVYGASKSMGESMAQMFHEDLVILRVASLFGIAGSSGKGGNFVETMIRLGRERGVLKVVDDVTMSPTATADVAVWLLAFLRADGPSGVYHAVNSGTATWYQFARQIIRSAGVEAEVVPVASDEFPTVAHRPAYSVLDNTKLSQVIGPIGSWHDALERYMTAKGHHAVVHPVAQGLG